MFDFKILFSTFIMVFLAELGDKTQLATMGFAAESKSMVSVFLGSALALCLSSALAVLAGACLALCLATLLGVLVGGVMAQYVPQSIIKKAAGIAFVVIGGLIIWGKW